MVTAPPLTALESTTAVAVDRLVGSVRAELDSLTLQLRIAIADADHAEECTRSLDDSDAYTFLAATLSQRLSTERAHLADELQAAEVSAARRIVRARADAAALVSSVHAAGQKTAAPPAAAAPKAANVAPTPYLPPRLLVQPTDRWAAQNGHAGGARDPSDYVWPTTLAAVSGRPVARTGFRRFLYADTILPMVAIVIVVIVLLAWIS